MSVPKELAFIQNIDKKSGLQALQNDRKNDPLNIKNSLFIERGSKLHHELKQLKSGEDSIAFFARNGSSTPIKFIHCNQAPTGPREFRP